MLLRAKALVSDVSVYLNPFTGNFLDIAQPYKLLASKY